LDASVREDFFQIKPASVSLNVALSNCAPEAGFGVFYLIVERRLKWRRLPKL
jgi:hypothetical protein